MDTAQNTLNNYELAAQHITDVYNAVASQGTFLGGKRKRGFNEAAEAAFGQSGFVKLLQEEEPKLAAKALLAFKQLLTACNRTDMPLDESLQRAAITLISSKIWIDRIEKAAANSARMAALNADPEFAAANSARASKRMKALHKNPDFAAARDKRLEALNANPEFAAASSARITALHNNPEFAAARDKRLEALHKDPAFKAKLRAGQEAYLARKRAEKAGTIPPAPDSLS